MVADGIWAKLRCNPSEHTMKTVSQTYRFLVELFEKPAVKSEAGLIFSSFVFYLNLKHKQALLSVEIGFLNEQSLSFDKKQGLLFQSKVKLGSYLKK